MRDQENVGDASKGYIEALWKSSRDLRAYIEPAQNVSRTVEPEKEKAGKKRPQEPFRGARRADTFSLISALTLTTSPHKLDTSPLTA